MEGLEMPKERQGLGWKWKDEGANVNVAILATAGSIESGEG